MAKLAQWFGILLVAHHTSMISGTPVCVYKDTFYISDTEIYDGGCNVAYCDKMAQLVYRHGCSVSTPGRQSKSPRRYAVVTALPPWIKPTARSTVIHAKPTTKSMVIHGQPTAHVFGCHVDGKVYPAGTAIYQGREDNWCYGKYCDSHGSIIYADDFNCFSSSGPTPTAIPGPTPTAIPPTTVPQTIPTKLSTLLSGKGCHYNGKFYPANTNLGAPDDRATKYCTKCDENAQIQHWYDTDCFRTGPIPLGSTPPAIVG